MKTALPSMVITLSGVMLFIVPQSPPTPGCIPRMKQSLAILNAKYNDMDYKNSLLVWLLHSSALPV